MTARKPVTTEEHRAAGNFVERWAVTHVNLDGYRVLTFAAQARNTFETEQEAQDSAARLLPENGAQRLLELFGNQALGTFRASRVECWRMYDGRIGDPRGIYWD